MIHRVFCNVEYTVLYVLHYTLHVVILHVCTTCINIYSYLFIYVFMLLVYSYDFTVVQLQSMCNTYTCIPRYMCTCAH